MEIWNSHIHLFVHLPKRYFQKLTLEFLQRDQGGRCDPALRRPHLEGSRQISRLTQSDKCERKKSQAGGGQGRGLRTEQGRLPSRS